MALTQPELYLIASGDTTRLSRAMQALSVSPSVVRNVANGDLSRLAQSLGVTGSPAKSIAESEFSRIHLSTFGHI